MERGKRKFLVLQSITDKITIQVTVYDKPFMPYDNQMNKQLKVCSEIIAKDKNGQRMIFVNPSNPMEKNDAIYYKEQLTEEQCREAISFYKKNSKLIKSKHDEFRKKGKGKA